MLGIDLGTQNTRVAYNGGDAPLLIGDEFGSPTIPSVVCLVPGTDAPLAGRRALAVALEYPQSTARSFKRRLGLPAKNEPLAPEASTRVLLAHCASRAAEVLGATSPYAALVAPAWFDEAQKAALRASAVAAGFQLVELISAPAAIALSIAREQERRVAIIDVGAGGISAAVVSTSKKHVELLAACSDKTIGGDDLDEAILERALRELPALGEKVHDPKQLARLRASCELAKREFYRGNRRPSREGTRARLDAMLDGLMKGIERVCEGVFQGSRVFRDQIHAIYLAGEMSRNERVRHAVRRIFGKSISEDIAPEAAAVGASIFIKARCTGRDLRVDEGPLASTMFPALVNLSPLSVSNVPSSSFEVPREPLSVNEVLKGGELFVPTTAAQILALPLGRPLSEDDVRPVALPVLLARILSRKQVTGTVTLACDKKKIDIPIHQGVGVLDKSKLGALGLAFRWPGGTYKFDFSIPRRDSNMHGFLGLTIRGLRNTMRAESEADLKKALADRLSLAPRLKADKAVNLSRFGLTVPENAFVKAACSGAISVEDALKRGGLAPEAALMVLVLLSAFNFVDWVRPGELDRTTSAAHASRA